MKKFEFLLGSICLALGLFVMVSGLLNQTFGLGFILAWGLVPVNAVLATDLYQRNFRQTVSFDLKTFLVQESALFYLTLGLISVTASLIILKGIIGL